MGHEFLSATSSQVMPHYTLSSMDTARSAVCECNYSEGRHSVWEVCDYGMAFRMEEDTVLMSTGVSYESNFEYG